MMTQKIKFTKKREQSHFSFDVDNYKLFSHVLHKNKCACLFKLWNNLDYELKCCRKNTGMLQEKR